MSSSMTNYMRSYVKRYHMQTTCVIEAETTTQDANFMNTTSWTSVATCKCRVLPAGQGDTERVEAEGFASQESIKVLKRLAVPHDVGVDVGQRVTVGGEQYYIAALNVNNTQEVFHQVLIVQMAGADNDG